MDRQELNEETRKAIFTVILNYDIPSDDKKAADFADKMSDMISKAMRKQENRVFWFDNPLICYNVDNVAGVQTDALESEELKEIIKKSYRKVGFVQD